MRTVALVGNPNSGKSTIFNALTGLRQKVGNWPGVTVDKKEGFCQDDSIHIIDLPGIYSLSPYSPEEIITRDFLLNNKVDLIVNIIDASNLERSLYLTTQLMDLHIPMVISLNMVDLLPKNYKIDDKVLSQILSIPIVRTNALKKTGFKQLENLLKTTTEIPQFMVFSMEIEENVASISNVLKTDKKLQNYFVDHNRFWSIKILEKDELIKQKLHIMRRELVPVTYSEMVQKNNSEDDINAVFETLFPIKNIEDIESTIISQRYDWIETVLADVITKKGKTVSITDRIDKIVTNRWLGLPIFALIMYVVYYLSISTLGTMGTDWINDVLFGEYVPNALTYVLESMNINHIIISLILDGIVAGIGAVIGFMPQMAVLFFCLAVLEDCGYMARVAFVMDRVFRRFGLSGKSFIPLLIGSGCSVPAIQSSRSIEGNSNRRITIVTTSFIPCSAKLPVIALIANAIFGGASWVAYTMYVVGIVSVLFSGLLLKKISGVSVKPTPFIMELPIYHLPKISGLLRQVWQKVKQFAKKAGTIIFISSCCVWFLSTFDFSLNEVKDSSDSMLAFFGNLIAPIFIPLGFGDWISATATIQGFVAKENVVSTVGILSGISGEVTEDTKTLLKLLSDTYTTPSAFSFLLFNMLCMPCFAAVGAMRSELKNDKLCVAAVCYQMLYAYFVSFVFYQISKFIVGGAISFAFILSIVLLIIFIIIVFCPKEIYFKYFSNRSFLSIPGGVR